MLPMTKRSSWSPLFDWESPFDLLARSWDRQVPERGESAVGAYPVDIREDDSHILVDAEMPGFNKEQIDVTLENGVLSITAERKVEKDQEGESHLRERRFTRIARAFKLPNAVDENKVEATLTDGVLHLVLHKREEVRPRKIQVK